MIFVRGIMGKIKLNPAIKLWGGLLLVFAGACFTLFVQFASYRDDVAACEAQGGIWIGGIPVRIGTFRALGGRCDVRREGREPVTNPVPLHTPLQQPEHPDAQL